ncbi:MAG TPA: aminomethyltransferase beta-barrel domain-containing protein, partial [Candidatus Binatia bacterium]|nr:aminomethyltransferase beta-barrel domain-containing protein [Candidatus Binatia bacterium]
ADRAKDQSYFLFALRQEQLARVLFPLGEMQKTEVRERARRLRLPAAERPESQDICFGDYKDLVASYAEKDELRGGDVINRSGKVLGRHHGIHSVTVGQRRGLGIAAAEPLYVIDIDDTTKQVTVGKKAELRCTGLIASGVNWIDLPDQVEFAAEVQIRYRAPAVPCMVRSDANGSCEVVFHQTVHGVTPGQAAVFYRSDEVLGGGWIERAMKEERQETAGSRP